MARTGSGTLSAWDRQIQNRNFLSPVGFKFNLSKAPKVDFFSTSANIPSIDLGVAIQPTYLKDIPIPGDKLVYNDFSINFLVDENLENYLQIHNWMRGLGYPESVQEYSDLVSEDPYLPDNPEAIYSDGTLLIFNSSLNPIVKVTFKHLFPVSLTQVEFDSQGSDITYVTATTVFKYTIYDIKSLI